MRTRCGLGLRLFYVLATAWSRADAAKRRLPDQTVHSASELSAFLAQIPLGAPMQTIVLPETANLRLGGSPLNVAWGTRVRIMSEGEGATIDGEGRSRLFEVWGSLTLVRVHLTAGHAESGGGLLANEGARVVLRHVTIRGCSATRGGAGKVASGGAVMLWGARLESRDSTISGCSATSTGDVNALGGAVYNWQGSVALTRTSVHDCRVVASGSGDDAVAYGDAPRLDHSARTPSLCDQRARLTDGTPHGSHTVHATPLLACMQRTLLADVYARLCALQGAECTRGRATCHSLIRSSAAAQPERMAACAAAARQAARCTAGSRTRRSSASRCATATSLPAAPASGPSLGAVRATRLAQCIRGSNTWHSHCIHKHSQRSAIGEKRGCSRCTLLTEGVAL
jgi:hypothetical protein